MIKRDISSFLTQWKAAPDRKVLLLRGARQVGKTFIAREFGKTFKNFVEVNFYETPEVGNFFKTGNLAPQNIIEKLELYYNVSITPGETLLFFDEIQSCPEAIDSLRFFYEKSPGLHLLATGALLEFGLNDVLSFGVGRIVSAFMYPISLSEFIAALLGEKFAGIVGNAVAINQGIEEVLHKKLIDAVTIHSIIGGLPGVVATYLKSHDLRECFKILDELIVGFEDDFAKYNEKVNPQKLRDTLKAIALQTGDKFVYSRIKPDTPVYGYDTALGQLMRAGLAYKINRVSANGIPLGAEIDEKRFKIILFDSGIYNRLLNLDLRGVIATNDIGLVNSGALAENICGLELVKSTPCYRRPELFYWTREAKGSNAEIDYVVQRGNTIVPIEVKAGTKGQMQSLYIFMKEKQLMLGVRTSIENFGRLVPPSGEGEVAIVPLYGIGRYVNVGASL
jgi:predicted AAA+ superfamily ATPase